MSPTDQVAEAMARLDDETRALLELSSQRNVSDDDLADLLRLEREEVAERRRRAELRLRLELGEVGHGGGGDEDDRAEPAERPSRRGWLVFGGLAAVVVVVLVIVLGGGGGGDEPKKAASKKEPAAQQAPAEDNSKQPAASSAGPVRTMQVLNDTHGRGTAQLVRTGNTARLRLKLSGFLTPSGGGYAVWLYNSQDDVRRLYATADTTIARDLTLPKDYKGFQYVDVARAVPDLDSDHSGLSLLRVRVADLAG